jgi:hypothetical protein
MTIPFLKSTHMQEAFKNIVEKIYSCLYNPSTQQFVEYVERIYIGKKEKQSLFKREDLSVFERCLHGATRFFASWRKSGFSPVRVIPSFCQFLYFFNFQNSVSNVSCAKSKKEMLICIHEDYT